MGSVLLEFVGDTPLFRVIDFLIENQGLDYSKTEIAKGADIGWSTLFKIWDKLEKSQIVKKTRAFGNTKLYTLNKSNQVVQNLLKLELSLIKQSANEEIQKQTITARA